jgi:hypothetical protein
MNARNPLSLLRQVEKRGEALNQAFVNATFGQLFLVVAAASEALRKCLAIAGARLPEVCETQLPERRRELERGLRKLAAQLLETANYVAPEEPQDPSSLVSLCPRTSASTSRPAGGLIKRWMETHGSQP